MKQGWEIKKLSEICVSYNGLWKGKNPPFTTIAVLRSTNFTKDCKIKLDDVAYIEVEEKSFAKRRLQKNDIVVERSGGGPNQPVGRVLLFDIEDENYSFCNFTSALRVLDTTIVSPIYLHRYLTYFYLSGQTINIQSNTIGLRNLDYTKYLDISIPVPPIAEQQRIVEILDREFEKIDALKANAERSLQQAKDLFQSALKQELKPKEGWVVSNLQALLKLTSGDNLTAKSIINGEYPVYGGNGIMGYHNQYNLDGQNIIVGRVGALCGNVRLVKGKIWYTDNAFLVHDKDSVFHLPYLTYELQRADLRQYATQAAQPVVSNASMKDVVLSAPPTKSEQEQIVARLDKLKEHCQTLEENYKKTIALCDDMKQALLRQAFNGEL